MKIETPENKMKVSCLGDYQAACEDLAPAEFVQRHGGSFFVYYGDLGSLNRPAGEISTLTMEGDALRHVGGFDPRSEFLVFPVRRASPPRPDSDDIWIGRDPGNDLVIPDISVSALHAIIKDNESGELLLLDVNSKNGTFVDNVPAPAVGKGAGVRLDSGATIRFGLVRMSFLAADEFRLLVLELLT